MNKAIVCVLLAVVITATGCTHLPLPEPKVRVPDAQIIAEDGQARMTIVVSAAASPSTRYAGEELQRFLGEMTGAEIPLVTDDAPAASSEIWVGESRRLQKANILIDYETLGTEGYVIRTRAPTFSHGENRAEHNMLQISGRPPAAGGSPRRSAASPSPACWRFCPLMKCKPILEYREPFVYECF